MKLKNIDFFLLTFHILLLSDQALAKDLKIFYKNQQRDGCYENSACHSTMATQIKEWEKMKNKALKAQKKASLLEAFRKKKGIPVEFYTQKKSADYIKPVFFHSPCPHHNSSKNHKIFRGLSFVKSLKSQKGILKLGDKTIEIPLGELFMLQPITIYRKHSQDRYYLPIGDQGLFIENKNLYSLREDDGMFYLLNASLSGDWKITSHRHLEKWASKIENTQCPKDHSSQKNKDGDFKNIPYFESEYCKKIWDQDEKKMVTIKMRKGCPI